MCRLLLVFILSLGCILVSNCEASDVTDMVLVEGGLTKVGLEKPIIPQDGEAPVREIEVSSFYLDKTEVTNRQFKQFVQHAHYVTEAETFGNSFVLQNFVSKELNEKIEQSVGMSCADNGASGLVNLFDFLFFLQVANAPWWLPVEGASWKHPEGPGTTIEDRLDHPVVHVSWKDANEFCKWKQKRLPFEAEWERACNGGKPNR